MDKKPKRSPKRLADVKFSTSLFSDIKITDKELKEFCDMVSFTEDDIKSGVIKKYVQKNK